MNKTLIISFVLFGVGLGLISNYLVPLSFGNLSVQEMHRRIIQKRDVAIEKAKRQGDYNCCYKPGCTMCFMGANKWNNEQAGTCDCAELIAQGEEPCPQCVEALSSSNSSCQAQQECN